MKAVEEDPNNIQYVENQTDDLCIVALKKNIETFKYIHNPSYDICVYYIDNVYRGFPPIENPSYNLCEYYVKKNNLGIYCFMNDCDNYVEIPEDYLISLIKIAVKNHINGLYFVTNEKYAAIIEREHQRINADKDSTEKPD